MDAGLIGRHFLWITGIGYYYGLKYCRLAKMMTKG